MKSLGEELRKNHAALVQRWYEEWRQSSHPRHDLGAAVLKNSLGAQFRLIGEQLRDLATAEHPEQIWTITERLDPEGRVDQEMPIEEVVQEYSLAIDVVRTWIEEQGIDVSFTDYSYFFRAMYELTAETVRRYTKHQTEVVRKQRAHYLAAVMHQLRTPISAVMMQVELLEQGGQTPDTEAVKRLRRNLRRVGVLVDGILRLERFQTWEVPVRPEEIVPAQLVDDLVSDHERTAARKGLRVEVHVNRSLRMIVDPDLFSDALGNLIQNAIKYTHDGFVIVEATEQEDAVVFSVRDSGPGIDAEAQRWLFKQSQPGSLGGAGIGLQIAQHAAQAQDGFIEVESEVGRGSTFSLCLPRVVSPRDGKGSPGDSAFPPA